MVAGSPFLCMRHTAHWLSATTCSAPGAASASTSLIIDGPAGVDRNGNFQGNAFQDRDHPAHFLFLGNRGRSGARRFAADVDQVGAVVCQLSGMSDSGACVEIAAAVGKGS